MKMCQLIESIYNYKYTDRSLELERFSLVRAFTYLTLFIDALDWDGCCHGKGDGLAGQVDPERQWVVADLFRGGGNAGCGWAGEGDWNWRTAGVAVGGQDSTDNVSVGAVVLPGKIVSTLVASHAVEEEGGKIVVLDGQDGPVDKAIDFLEDSLDPHLEEGANGLSSDGVCW